MDVCAATAGRETQTKSLNGDGSTAKTITRMFDALGRQTNYTDSEGHSSSVSSFDILSRPVTSNDGKATRTSSYDATTGDLTGVSDSGAGSFSASYDAAGRITATTLPGGIVRSLQYDESGSVVYTAYTRTTGCSSNCVLYEQFAVENAHGQYNALWENMQGQDPNNQYYEYDHAGRLTRVQDWRDDSGTYKCTERTYEYDADSNRTKRKVAPETADDCDWGGAGTVQNNSYDAADRQIDAGYVYDAFGRITTVPSADAGSLGDLTATYYASDLVHSVAQGGSTQTFALDPNQRVSVKTKTGGTSSTESYAYTDDSDSPAWTATTTGSATTWSRTVDGIAGADAAQDSATGVKLLIQNIRGDVVAQATTAGVLSAASKVDEFGVPKAALTGKYAFHGSKQREALTSAGIVAMGVRLYQPEMGRFLQVDPVLGGTANPYEYPSDPINQHDLDGRKKKKAKAKAAAGTGANLVEKSLCVLQFGKRACQLAAHLGDVAVRNTKRLFNLSTISGTDGTIANAFQHCYWSALMTQQISRVVAKGIGDLHEARPYNDETLRDMDLYNNMYGRRYGANSKTAAAARGKCYKAANNGKLSRAR